MEMGVRLELRDGGQMSELAGSSRGGEAGADAPVESGALAGRCEQVGRRHEDSRAQGIPDTGE